MSSQFITSTEGHDDDPDYDSYVLWATICFLVTGFGIVLTYCACNYCKRVQPTTVEIGPYPCLEPLCCSADDKDKKAEA